MDYDILIEKATEVMKNAYAPYSHFQVGACILGDNGEYYTGCNVENVSYGATICAERGAMMKAVADGCTHIDAIAIVSSSGEYTYPCGICRQFLSEFAAQDTPVVLSNQGGMYIIPFCNLLPDEFKL